MHNIENYDIHNIICYIYSIVPYILSILTDLFVFLCLLRLSNLLDVHCWCFNLYVDSILIGKYFSKLTTMLSLVVKLFAGD